MFELKLKLKEMKSIIISQNIFKNWGIKDLWEHYQHLQETPNKINNKILKFVIKEIKSR